MTVTGFEAYMAYGVLPARDMLSDGSLILSRPMVSANVSFGLSVSLFPQNRSLDDLNQKNFND